MKRAVGVVAGCVCGLAAWGQTAVSDSLYGVAYELYEAGKYAKALPVFERVLEMDRADVPDDTELHSYDEVGIAACFFGMGKVEEAAGHEPLWYEFKPVDRRLMGDVRLYSRMAQQATSTEGAILWMERMLEAEKKALGDDSYFLLGSYCGLANLEIQRGDEGRTRMYLAKARKIIKGLPPSKVQAYKGMPSALESALEDAVGNRERADSLARDAWGYLQGHLAHLPYLYGLAMNGLLTGHLQNNDIEGALPITEAATAELMAVEPERFAQNPDYGFVAVGLAQFYSQTSMADRGLDVCDFALPLVKNDMLAYTTLLQSRATMHKIKGNTAQAVADMEACVKQLRGAFKGMTHMLAMQHFALGEAYDADRQYKKAREAYGTALNGFRAQGEEGYAGYVSTLHHLGALATRTNDFKAAAGYIDECLDFMKAKDIGTRQDEAYLWKERGNCCQGMKENGVALDNYRRSMAISDEAGLGRDNNTYFEAALNVYALLMQDDPESAEAAAIFAGLEKACAAEDVVHRRLRMMLLEQHAGMLYAAGKGDEALKIVDKAIGLAGEAEVPEIDYLIQMKCNLLIILYRYDEAMELVRSFEEEVETQYGKDSRQYVHALCLGLRALMQFGGCADIGDLIEMSLEMEQVAKKVYEPGDPERYVALSWAAHAQSSFAPLQAKRLIDGMQAEIKRTGTDVDVYGTLYSALMNVYRAMGKADKLVECADKTLKIAEAMSSVDDASAMYLNAGVGYLNASRLADAEKALLKSKELAEGGSGAVNGILLQLYYNLSDLYQRMGRTELAAEMRELASEMTSRFSQGGIAGVMNAYADVWDKYRRGLKEKCRNDIDKIVSALSEVPEKASIDRSLGYRLYAMYWMYEGDLEQAWHYIDLATGLQNNVADNMLVAAQIAYAREDYAEARDRVRKALSVTESVLGRTAMQTVPMHKLLGDVYVRAGDAVEAERSYRKAFDNGARYIYDNLLTLTAAQRADFWASNYEFFRTYLPSTGRCLGGEQLNGLIYDATLFSNGLLLNADKHIARAVQSCGDEGLLGLYAEVNATKEMLRRQADMGMEPAKELSDNVAAKERQLLGALAESGVVDASRLRAPSWSNVRKALPKRGAAVEFLDFNVSPDTCAGMALVVTRDMKQPRLVELYTRHVDDDLQTDDLYMSTALGDTLWGKIRAAAPDCEEIYFTPQGPLCSIAIEYLPVSEGKLPAMHRLTSTAELAASRRKRAARDGSTLYGGLNYDTSVDSLRADADKYPELQHRGYVPGADLGRFSREGAKEIPYLKGTRVELDSIGALMARTMRSEPRRYVWNDGTETSFKALSGKYGRVLHIGTHGFFMEGDSDASDPGLTAEDLALQRSGLLLSGAANRYLDRAEIPDDMDDGILRASEIADLDFDGVDMTVLSACETGLGRVTADGVFGLQRGFKKAGAGSIMMSLWKVDDAATCRLMTEFYRHWLGDAEAGIAPRSKHDALLAARDIVRAQPEWAQPEFWAAFILLDALE